MAVRYADSGPRQVGDESDAAFPASRAAAPVPARDRRRADGRRAADAVVTLPSDARTIILAIDVSLSMRAQGRRTQPDGRRAGCGQGVREELPHDIRAGIVTFAGTALLVQPPTQNREDLVAAIDRFQLQRHTAIGSGIIVSLATLFPDEGIDLENVVFGNGFRSRDNARRNAPDRPVKTEKKPFKPVPPGSYTSAAIILLTDGRRTTGPDPLDAARMAADHGVRVFTVGFGSSAGGAVDIDGMSIYMRFDEETLKGIAGITQAEYFHAELRGRSERSTKGSTPASRWSARKPRSRRCSRPLRPCWRWHRPRSRCSGSTESSNRSLPF